MLQSLDIFTLGLCSTLASGAFGVVFFALWRRAPAERHLLHWALSSWFYGLVLVSLFTIARDSLPLGALFFMLMGFTDVLIVSGIHRFDGEVPFCRWMVIPVLAPMLGHSLPILLGSGDHSPLAEVSEAIGLAVAMGLSGLAVLRTRRGAATSRARTIAGLALLAYVPGYVAVIVITIWFPQSSALLPRIPMLADQLLLGVLNLGLLAIPAERAHERLRMAASRDPLTGAWNRDGLARLGADLLRPGGAVIAIDIDRFKEINDDHGHGSGDDVLVAVAKATSNLVAPRDGELFRIGGDEFVAILPKCDATEGRRLAERLRHSGEHASGLPDWTLSIGIALVEDQELDVETAIKSADEALYRAKALGRDRAHLVTA